MLRSFLECICSQKRVGMSISGMKSKSNGIINSNYSANDDEFGGFVFFARSAGGGGKNARFSGGFFVNEFSARQDGLFG